MANKLVDLNKTHKSLKLKIYPNQEQIILINKTFGCCRLVYNERLQERNEFYIENIIPIPKENKTERNQKYKEYKPSDLKTQFPFLSEVSSQALCQSENDLKNAYNNFFKSNKGIRKGKSGFPKFKSKKNNRQSYRECMVSETALNFFRKYIKIPKLGKVAFSHDSLPKWYSKKAKLCNITVEKSCSNRYYAVLLFEIDKPNYKIENRKEAIGLDFSPSEMYVSSENQTGKDFGYIAQKQKYHKRLRRLQRIFARRQMIKQENSPRKLSSKNREKARIKLARLEEHIAFCRKDWIEKETLRLVSSYQVIGIENLSIQGMMKGSRNAKNYQDISWSTFVSKLEQKSQFKNCQIVKVDKFFASSQLCNCCGFKNPDVQKFHLENWKCPQCGTEHQRDENAALNIRAEAIRVLREAEENQEKSRKNDLSKDTDSVLSVEELANLALSTAQ